MFCVMLHIVLYRCRRRLINGFLLLVHAPATTREQVVWVVLVFPFKQQLSRRRVNSPSPPGPNQPPPPPLRSNACLHLYL